MTTSLKRSGHGRVEWFALLQSVGQCVYGYSGALSPFGQCVTFPMVLNDAVVSFVKVLLAIRRPATVRRLVRAVIVDAVQCVCRRWALPHISKEGREVTPCVAGNDATAAVSVVVRRIWVQAALPHHVPDTILGSLMQTMAGDSFTMQAAATLRIAGSQVAGSVHGVAAAVTATVPSSRTATLRVLRSCDDSQAAESLTDQLGRLPHPLIIAQVAHA